MDNIKHTELVNIINDAKKNKETSVVKAHTS